MGRVFPADGAVQWSSSAAGCMQRLQALGVQWGQAGGRCCPKGERKSRDPELLAEEQRLEVVSISWSLTYQCTVTRKRYHYLV